MPLHFTRTADVYEPSNRIAGSVEADQPHADQGVASAKAAIAATLGPVNGRLNPTQARKVVSTLDDADLFALHEALAGRHGSVEQAKKELRQPNMAYMAFDYMSDCRNLIEPDSHVDVPRLASKLETLVRATAAEIHERTGENLTVRYPKDGTTYFRPVNVELGKHAHWLGVQMTKLGGDCKRRECMNNIANRVASPENLETPPIADPGVAAVYAFMREHIGAKN